MNQLISHHSALFGCIRVNLWVDIWVYSGENMGVEGYGQ